MTRAAALAVIGLPSGCEGTVQGGNIDLVEIVPASGSARGGAAVELRGEGFTGGAMVRLGDVDVAVEFVDDGTLRILTPRATAGPVDIEVTVPSGDRALVADAFTYTPLDPDFVDAPGGYLPDPGVAPAAVVAGDIDGDGDADLVLAFPPAGVEVWLNSGLGAYEPATDELFSMPPVTGATRRLALEDLDGDGRLDLFVCHGASEANRLLLGVAGGLEEAPPGTHPLRSDDCTDLIADDLDGDGRPELVLLGRGRDGSGAARSTLRVLWNGSEGGATLSPGDQEPLADLIEQGLPDGAARVSGAGTAELIGVPDGEDGLAAGLRWTGAEVGSEVTVGFSILSTVPADRLAIRLIDAAGSSPFVRVEDAEGELFEADPAGDVDLPALGAPDPEGLGGAGVFDLPVSLVTVGSRVGDGGADGELRFDDVRLESSTGGTTILVADFEHRVLPLAAAPGESSVIAGDFDGDGLPDLAVSRASGTGPAFRVALRRGDGFEAQAEGRFPPGLDGLAVAAGLPLDLDDDAVPDLFAVVRNGQDRALLNDGAGYFFDETPVAVPVETADGRGAARGDLDLDGRPELLVANDGGADRILHPDGEGRLIDWTARAPITLDRSTRVVAVDVDGDGDLDLITFGPDRPPRLLVSVE